MNKKEIKKLCNASIGKKYQDKFDRKKFFSGFLGLLDPIGWAKDIVGIFNIRKLVLYVAVIICFSVYFYVQGRGNNPVQIDIGFGKEAIIEINKEGDQLYIDKKGFVYIRDKEGNILKQVSVSDIPGLKKKLAPVGFQFVPIGVMGGGLGLKGAKFEGGFGVSFFRYWKMELESFLTNAGIYIGSSYKITDNSGLGIGVGKGFKGDSRVLLYYRWKF